MLVSVEAISVQYWTVGISALSVLSALLAYLLGLRIQHDILQNNEKIEREMSTMREKLHNEVTAIQDEIVRELGATITRNSDRIDRLDREVSDSAVSLYERILTIINGKYVRVEVYQTSALAVQDKFASMKEIVEVNLAKIEQGLDLKIFDLKDRLFDKDHSQ